MAGDGIRLERTRVDGVLDDSTTGQFDGVINNDGSIESESTTGATAGVRTVDGVDFQGELNNAGLINGEQNGVYFGDGDHTGGVLNNTGSITSDSRVLNIDGTGLEVNNDAFLFGTDDQRNGTVYADSTADDFTFNNSGSISPGTFNDGAGFSAELSEEGNTFVFNNDGSIGGGGNAEAGSALAADGIRLERTRVDGALDDSTTGQFDGEINNDGGIFASSTADGVAIAGVRAVDGVDFQGELNNDGTINGSQSGVYLGEGDHTGGVINNNGEIEGNRRGLNIDGTGLEVNNDGAIIGGGDQVNGTIYADSTAQDFTINNTGLVDANPIDSPLATNQGAGISAELAEEGNTFEINNEGLIQGRGEADAGSALAGDGIRLERTRVDGVLDDSTTGQFDGVINNDGSIESESTTGATAGVRIVDGVDFQGQLNNTGLINGEQNGVYFGDGDHTGGVLNNNAALISSDSRALNIDGTGLEINNNGVIEGTGDQRNGTVFVDGTADQFTINNSGTINAAGETDSFAGTGVGSGVSIEVGSEAGDVQTGSLNNSGEILGAGDLAEDVGVRLAAGAEGDVTFEGDIVNSGLISAETDNAILVEEGVNFDGDVINSGTIDGGIELASGDILLSDGSIIYLDVNSQSEAEQINTQGDVTLGGTLNVRFEDGFTPEVGETFDFIDSGATFGSFNSVESEGIEFDTANLAVDGTVVVLSNGAMAVVDDGDLVVIAEPGEDVPELALA